MKLFIFEPYEWVYCGGAIGAIAETFDKAVNLIIESGREGGHERYKVKFFQPTAEFFKEDSWDQWLLTCELTIIDDGPSRVIFDNWNYA